MTRPPLTSALLNSVSYGAQEFCLYPYLFGFQIDEGYENSVEYTADAVYGFLVRIRLWLQLLWGKQGAVFNTHPVSYNMTINRQMMRRRRHKGSTTRQADSLAYHILCRYGLKRCQQWLYNRTLTARVHWCFAGQWRWASRESVADCVGFDLIGWHCAAPLRPD